MKITRMKLTSLLIFATALLPFTEASAQSLATDIPRRLIAIDNVCAGDHEGALEPRVLELKDGRVRMLIRKARKVFWDSFSSDGGKTWPAAKATTMDANTSFRYLTRLSDRRIGDSVGRAINDLRPEEIAFGRVDVPEHVFNLQWFMKEGTMPVTPFGGTQDKVKMNPPGGSLDLVTPAGPTNPTVSFIALRKPAGRLISIYSASSLLYVGGVGERHISADFYGIYCEPLKKLQHGGESDPPFVVMMANGTSGDINNNSFCTQRPGKPLFEQIRFVAENVADNVNAALAQTARRDSTSLDAHYRAIGIAWRKVEPEPLAWSKETEAKATRIQSKAVIATMYAGRVERLANASPKTKAPVHVLRIGDVCIGTSPCETFAETGIEFKKRSPFAHSFMVEPANGYYGYMLISNHFKLGGYETGPGTNYLEPQASVKIAAALLGTTA